MLKVRIFFQKHPNTSFFEPFRNKADALYKSRNFKMLRYGIIFASMRLSLVNAASG